MNWYFKVLRNYAGFSGRARRTEYWMFVLFNLLFAIAAVVLDNLLGVALQGIGYGPLYLLYALVVFIPGLAVSVRRLHDTGKSGWMLLLTFIPIIGGIWLLILMATDSDPGENQYGANPKQVEGAEVVSEESTSDSIILVVLVWMFISGLLWKLIPKLFDNFYGGEWVETISIATSFIWAFIPIVLAFAIKDEAKRIPLFVIAGLYLVFDLYTLVLRIIESNTWNFI